MIEGEAKITSQFSSMRNLHDRGWKTPSGCSNVDPVSQCSELDGYNELCQSWSHTENHHQYACIISLNQSAVFKNLQHIKVKHSHSECVAYKTYFPNITVVVWQSQQRHGQVADALVVAGVQNHLVEAVQQETRENRTCVQLTRHH